MGANETVESDQSRYFYIGYLVLVLFEIRTRLLKKIFNCRIFCMRNMNKIIKNKIFNFKAF